MTGRRWWGRGENGRARTCHDRPIAPGAPVRSPFRPPPHTLSTVIPAKAGIHLHGPEGRSNAAARPSSPSPLIPAKAGIQVRPPTKNAAYPGPPSMADMTVHTSGRLSIPVDANLDPRLRGDDGGGGRAGLGEGSA